MTRILSTTFCDDVRQEIGGKLSLIGVYNGVMYVPQFPVTLPKLWVLATYSMPQEEPPKDLKVRILKNTEPLADLDATPEYLQQLANLREPVVAMPDGIQRVITSHMHVCFSPLVLEGPCMLRVVAITDKGEVRGLGLQIQQQSALTATPPAGSAPES
jgi:hypothetical protein